MRSDPAVDDIFCITVLTLNFGNYGMFFIAGNAGVESSTGLGVFGSDLRVG